VPAIIVLYLPRDEKLRAVIETSLAFVEEVYKDEVLSGLRLVVFDMDDALDVKNATITADIAGFSTPVERKRLRVKVEPRLPIFYSRHYSPVERYAWIPVSRHWSAPAIFSEVVHEITHHPIFYVPREDKSALVGAFSTDLGLEELTRRYRGTMDVALELIATINEVVVIYITSNYFQNLNREPVLSTIFANIRNFALERYHSLIRHPPRSKEDAMILSEVFKRMSHRDLANLRRAVHEVFVKLIKKFPVDVLESNRAKYEVLYRITPPYH
jgi:hypothetical protein